eukprot:scaffold7125_cov54-Phaeocystis_antarctica.AAC.7
MGTPRSEHASAAIRGKLYVFGGGKYGNDRVASVEAYDPISNTCRGRTCRTCPVALEVRWWRLRSECVAVSRGQLGYQWGRVWGRVWWRGLGKGLGTA